MITIRVFRAAAAIATVLAATTLVTSASANPFFLFELFRPNEPQVERAMPGPDYTMPGRLKRQVVDYRTIEAPGTIIIDTPNTYLYLVLGNGRALRYGIGVGRDGFTWSGVHRVSQKREWPDWTPPADMLRRRPDLPRHMNGGPDNPLGARAMYLGSTLYRIHGSNEPWTIGTHVSSGCFRMTNEDVTDLYSRVNVGTKVVVLPMIGRLAAAQ